MDQQQYRRDREQLMNQERALISAQQARENLRMLARSDGSGGILSTELR